MNQVWEGKTITEKYDVFSLYPGTYHFPISIKVQFNSIIFKEPFSTSPALNLALTGLLYII